MSRETISPPALSPRASKLRIGLPERLQSLLFYIFFAITALALFIPFNPRMPNNDAFDSSWEFAMNQAVAQHLSFGEAIVFTYGPYASVITRTYDPATDLRMMCGSLLVGVSYTIALLYLARGRKRYLVVLLLLFLAAFGNPELLLLSYSFLLVVCVLKHAESHSHERTVALSWRQVLAVVLMLSALGLLPLVKGSLLLPFLAAVAIPAAFLLYRARFGYALLWLLIPITTALSFWIIGGQSLADLPGYLRGIISLTSGYTEVMSIVDTILPGVIANGLVILFLVLSASIILLVCRATQLTSASKWTLNVLCALFLLVTFKHTVITDAVSGAFSALFLLIVFLALLIPNRYLVWMLSIVLVLTAATSVRQDPVLVKAVHDRYGAGVNWGGNRRADIFAFCLQKAPGAYSRATYKSTWETYSEAWKGFRSRVAGGDVLADRFEKAKANIRSGAALPALTGTVDIYTYDLSALLASSNKWNPRPVILSLNAYTPVLARINEQHLRGPDAPDWVLFDLTTMAGQLPSLADGMSWPALWDNYTFISYDGRFILLRKNGVTHPSSNYEDISAGTFKTGDAVRIPTEDGLLIAEIDLKPTLLGEILTEFYRPPQLHMTLEMEGGEIRKYRVISKEMETGFLLSPFVSNTAEFASLEAGPMRRQNEKKVVSISVAPSYGGSVFWSGTYALTLKKYVGE